MNTHHQIDDLDEDEAPLVYLCHVCGKKEQETEFFCSVPSPCIVCTKNTGRKKGLRYLGLPTDISEALDSKIHSKIGEEIDKEIAEQATMAQTEAIEIDNPTFLILAACHQIGELTFYKLEELDKLLNSAEGDVYRDAPPSTGATIKMAACCKPGTSKDQVEKALLKDLEKCHVAFFAIYRTDSSSIGQKPIRIETEEATFFMHDLL